MGGVTLVAVSKDGRIAWEPVDGMDSVASRDAQRRARQEEARWLREQEHAIKDQRVAEAKDIERRERQRKAQMLGAENVYRTTKVRGPLVPVPKLLLETRAEEESARSAGLPQSNPKKYQFIKESLDALEKEYTAKEHAAREAAYDRNRRRLRVAGSNDAGADEDGEDDEEEDLRTRLSKMTDDEFKALAMERKARADKEISGAVSGGGSAAAAATAPSSSEGRAAGERPKSATPRANGANGRGGRGGRNKQQPVLDPKDDPDYRR